MSYRAAFRSLADVLCNLRVIIISMIIGVLLVMAVSFMVFTRKEVTRSTTETADESALNVLRVVKLNIENEYKSLSSFKQYAVERYREQLKTLVGVVVAQIDFFHEMAQKGILSDEQAKALALEAVEKLRYGKNDYFFIYDRNNIAISHPNASIRGRDQSEVKDADGRSVLNTLWNEAGEKKDQFFTVLWLRLGESVPIPKMLYYSYYPQWDWMIGTGVYIDDIDADVRKKVVEIMDVLKETFAHVKISESGYFFLFDGSGKILIHPFLPAETYITDIRDAATGRNHLRNLIEASRNPAVPWRYYWDKPDYPSQYRFAKYTHVERFEPFDWYIASSVYEDEMARPAEKIVQRQMVIVSVIVLVCGLAAYLLISRVTRPIAGLSDHTDRLQKADFSLPKEEADRVLAMTFPTEVGRLARTIWNMGHRLQEYLANFAEATAARERIESEMRIARDIQMSMLPQEHSLWNDRAIEGLAPLDLAAVMKPARDVGGDLYDFFFIDAERVCLVVGDVSDKGIPAALFMARSMALLRSTAAARSTEAPSSILSVVNSELTKGNEMRMFLTAFLGILHMKTGELIYSNAGHMAPFLLRSSGGCLAMNLPRGLPLGVSPKAKYSCEKVLLGPGDGLVLFSDGITEAAGPDDAFFGEERLEALLGAHQEQESAQGVVEKVMHEVNTFTQGTPQSDDITLLCARLTGIKSSYIQQKVPVFVHGSIRKGWDDSRG